MSFPLKLLATVIAVFHVAVFVVEAFFWMRPGVHNVALKRLVPEVGPDPINQALTLKALFVNLGYYNLFLAGAGIAGLVLLMQGNQLAGRALIAWMSISALCAGIVLLFSTQALIGAAFQSLPAALLIILMARDHVASTSTR